MKRVLLLGGTGFIGSLVLAELRRRPGLQILRACTPPRELPSARGREPRRRRPGPVGPPVARRHRTGHHHPLGSLRRPGSGRPGRRRPSRRPGERSPDPTSSSRARRRRTSSTCRARSSTAAPATRRSTSGPPLRPTRVCARRVRAGRNDRGWKRRPTGDCRSPSSGPRGCSAPARGSHGFYVRPAQRDGAVPVYGRRPRTG